MNWKHIKSTDWRLTHFSRLSLIACSVCVYLSVCMRSFRWGLPCRTRRLKCHSLSACRCAIKQSGWWLPAGVCWRLSLAISSPKKDKLESCHGHFDNYSHFGGSLAMNCCCCINYYLRFILDSDVSAVRVSSCCENTPNAIPADIGISLMCINK